MRFPFFDLAICSSTRYDAHGRPFWSPDETSILLKKCQKPNAKPVCYSRQSCAGRTSHRVTFGFSPKISTTVENAVENPGEPDSSTGNDVILLAFLRGETAGTAI